MMKTLNCLLLLVFLIFIFNIKIEGNIDIFYTNTVSNENKVEILKV